MPRTYASYLFLTAIAALTNTACSDTTKPDPDLISPAPLTPIPSPEPFDFAATSKQRQTASPAALGDLAALVKGNTNFAFRLLTPLMKEAGSKNTFYSPHSISLAFAMTFAGAKGDTAKQMAETMNFTLDPAKLHPAFNALDSALSQRGQGAKGADGKPFRLQVVNRVWTEKTLALQTPFVDTLSEQYGAKIPLVDFVTAFEPARVSINDWVQSVTEERIKNLLPPGSLTKETRLVLTNAVYFNGAWAQAFEEKATRPMPFTLASGQQKSVPMMSAMQRYPYTETDEAQVVELPYEKEKLSLVVVLPKPEVKLADLTSRLNATQWSASMKKLSKQEVALQLPKFRIEGETISLKQQLKALGMADAFDKQKADLTAMATLPPPERLFLSDVYHQGFVDVSEKGTEAAAATAVGVSGTTPVSNDNDSPIPVIVDHPFLFAIRDRATGALLFVGTINDPS